jgi:glycerol kinase
VIPLPREYAQNIFKSLHSIPRKTIINEREQTSSSVSGPKQNSTYTGHVPAAATAGSTLFAIRVITHGGRTRIISGMPFVLAIDQGTTGSTALAISRQGDVIGRAYSEFTQHYPRPGWVEHDAEEIWRVSRQVMAEALAEALENAGPADEGLCAIGITNQRETTVVWDRETGRPVHKAVVWQSRQSAAICQQMREDGHEALFRERTGLVMDAYFSGTKIRWILDQDPELRKRAEAGELAFGTIDSWLLWNLTGGGVHLTDPTNASRTLLYNIHDLDWDPELCGLLDVPVAMLPGVKPSSGIFGETADLEGLPAGIPIAGMAGDQQAALYGQGCWSAGQAKNTYGTGCFMLMNMGSMNMGLMNMGREHAVSRHGLLTTVCCDAIGQPAYALEGSVFIAGAAVQWLRDELGIIDDAAQTDALARELASNEGVYLVPAFAGLGAPYWDMEARGAIVGLTRGSGRAHLARAALESIAYQSRDIVEAMKRDSGIELSELRVDGGASRNDLLMQFQADMLGVPVDRPSMVETTAAGSAFLAGLAVGLWSSPEELATARNAERRFEPTMDSGKRTELYNGWLDAVSRVRSKQGGEEPTSPQAGRRSVAHHTLTARTVDGLDLFTQTWSAPSPAGVIVIVHGLAEHSGRYSETARFLAGLGWAVYACDLRGHGLSPDGRHRGRVHVDAFSDYARDVSAVLALTAHRHAELPLVILGHSMGGLIAITYALDHPDSLDGAVISSPALGAHPQFAPPFLLKLLVGILSRIAPRALFKSDLDTSAISRDADVVRAYISDPLVSEKVSARWYATMMKAMADANRRAASLRIPMLLMQSGADLLVDPGAPGRWAQRAPEDLVEQVLWDGLYHEMLNEPEKDQVRERITSWLEKNIKTD